MSLAVGNRRRHGRLVDPVGIALFLLLLLLLLLFTLNLVKIVLGYIAGGHTQMVSIHQPIPTGMFDIDHVFILVQ